MIVLENDIHQFVILDLKSQPPVSGHVEAPGTLSRASKDMHSPKRPNFQFLDIFNLIENSEHSAELAARVGREPSGHRAFRKSV
jgi:hypothetical protein